MVVRRERRGSSLLLTVDRPAARNAIDARVVDGLRLGLDAASADTTVHAVILAATGDDVFLSGGDLKELARLPLDASGADQVLNMGLTLAAIESCPVPVVAAVHGETFGGGCELLMMCDVIVMERRAGLRFVHGRMGLVPAWGGATRLHERVGATRTADILLTARRIGADEAHGMGLVSRVVDDGGALDEAIRIGEQLGLIARPALANMAKTLLETKTARRGDALDRERKVFRTAWGSEQHRAAFDRIKGSK